MAFVNLVGRLGVLAACLASAACTCPTSARKLADLDRSTPAHALESYQSYLAFDLRDLEYRCFSTDFRRRNRLSLANYAEGRDRLLREQPWLRSFAGAKITAQGANADGSHWIDARVLGRTVRVRLVREDFFEIRSADGLLADGYGRVEDWLATEAGGSSPVGPGASLVARIPTEHSSIDLAQATQLHIARDWKIDDFQSPPAP